MTNATRNAVVDALVTRREEIISEIAVMSPAKDGTTYHLDRVAQLQVIARQLRSLDEVTVSDSEDVASPVVNPVPVVSESSEAETVVCYVNPVRESSPVASRTLRVSSLKIRDWSRRPYVRSDVRLSRV